MPDSLISPAANPDEPAWATFLKLALADPVLDEAEQRAVRDNLSEDDLKVVQAIEISEAESTPITRDRLEHENYGLVNVLEQRIVSIRGQRPRYQPGT